MKVGLIESFKYLLFEMWDLFISLIMTVFFILPTFVLDLVGKIVQPSVFKGKPK